MQKFCWLYLLIFVLFLLFWYNYLTRNHLIGNLVDLGLHGYVKVSPGIRSSFQYLALRCASCAVVSSSGQVLGSRRGREIDGHDCVIRMNVAPTLGFEADVGSKTTVRVISHTSVRHLLPHQALFFKENADTRYVVWGPERKMSQVDQGPVFKVLAKLAQKYPDTHIYTFSRKKVIQCDGIFENETGKNRMKSGAFLSTGFFTLIFALDVCDSINVYGMIDGSYCGLANYTSVPYHYYESGRLDECGMYKMHERARYGGHRFITEKRIYRRWASQGKLRFQHPAWRLNLKLNWVNW
ncbi:alpha-N-acetyl-neuraminyl-2,3-beta-galactosyl-1,3-N-acetyl-galactosaminide alpha-2,6-sialyltransferase [Trichomycterus rosablanca]|uniref:alpha-N-acetyl-neuraminyl-2,3-beta-galactosyl-1, 3-N-acetyl-galactosaminide alpha-2,6-sialyltransferase n=1 Tax=Trichomycterus rosablanca TaxID=2290929 RepID=UPI002F351E1A